MSIKYCELCKREVEPRRQIGVGTLLMVFITFGMWLFLIPLYSKKCPICKGEQLTKNY
jgi:hypothetical protein